MNCPWTNFDPATARFCEEELCSWIRQPSNTWSNLAFLVAGLLILKKCRSIDYSEMRLFGYSAICICIGSGLFHLSGTFLFEVFDQMAMFMMACLGVVLNLQRLLSISSRTVNLIYIVLVLCSVAINTYSRPSGIPLFGTQIAAAATIELLCHLRRDKVDYIPLIGVVLSFGLAFTFWKLDIHGILCDPTNHYVTGHAVWHVLNGFAIYFLFQFYRQFKFAERGVFSLELRQ